MVLPLKWGSRGAHAPFKGARDPRPPQGGYIYSAKSKNSQSCARMSARARAHSSYLQQRTKRTLKSIFGYNVDLLSRVFHSWSKDFSSKFCTIIFKGLNKYWTNFQQNSLKDMGFRGDIMYFWREVRSVQGTLKERGRGDIEGEGEKGKARALTLTKSERARSIFLVRSFVYYASQLLNNKTHKKIQQARERQKEF